MFSKLAGQMGQEHRLAKLAGSAARAWGSVNKNVSPLGRQFQDLQASLMREQERMAQEAAKAEAAEAEAAQPAPSGFDPLNITRTPSGRIALASEERDRDKGGTATARGSAKQRLTQIRNRVNLLMKSGLMKKPAQTKSVPVEARVVH